MSVSQPFGSRASRGLGSKASRGLGSKASRGRSAVYSMWHVRKEKYPAQTYTPSPVRTMPAGARRRACVHTWPAAGLDASGCACGQPQPRTLYDCTADASMIVLERYCPGHPRRWRCQRHLSHPICPSCPRPPCRRLHAAERAPAAAPQYVDDMQAHARATTAKPLPTYLQHPVGLAVCTDMTCQAKEDGVCHP